MQSVLPEHLTIHHPRSTIMSSKRVLIVGGVAGGASCAARLRRMDERADIFIFERSGEVSLANCGLPYYIGGAIADRRRLLVSTPERFRDLFNVEVRTRHEVRRIDRRSRTIEVQNLQTGAAGREPYDVLVLATGAAPVRPPLPGIDLPGIFTLRDLHDADQIHAWIERRKASRAVVVGGGYIGLEMVENLSRRGIAVTLLEMTDQVMPPMDPEMVAPVQRELERQGVELRLGNAVAAFEPGPNETVTVVAQARRAAFGRVGDFGGGRQARHAIGPRGGAGDWPDRRRPRGRPDAHQRCGDFRGGRRGGGPRLRDRPAGLDSAGGSGQPAGTDRRRRDFRPRRPLPRLAGDRRGRRLRSHPGHDRARRRRRSAGRTSPSRNRIPTPSTTPRTIRARAHRI